MKRTMKILMSTLLVVCLLACLVACGGSSKGPSGKYTLVSMDADGMSMDAEMLKSLGLEITIEFNSDGTGTLDMAGESESFEWKDNKITSSNGGEMTFVLDGNTLTISEDEGTMVFEK